LAAARAAAAAAAAAADTVISIFRIIQDSVTKVQEVDQPETKVL
jgi:hypothetical protein